MGGLSKLPVAVPAALPIGAALSGRWKADPLELTAWVVAGALLGAVLLYEEYGAKVEGPADDCCCW